jgi:hypothetical protein
MVANALDARKLTFVVSCKMPTNHNQLQRNEVKYTTNFMRLWNEALPDSFCCCILVILKNAVN